MATKAPAIGIDLGTTNSCVAVYWKGRVEIIANDLGSRTTPSCVAFTNTERLVGEAARHQMSMNHKNTIYDVKRLIGRKFKEDNVQEDIQHYPFEVINCKSTPNINVTHKEIENHFCPEEISALVLTKMKETAEAYLEMKVKNAVITVPAHFNDSQRLATIDAGKIAGLNVLGIINEPTAAAIAYGLGKEKVGKRNILVYDLGGGSFDVTILSIDSGIYKVLSTSGDTHLGGEDFNSQLVNHCVEDFKKKHDKDLTTNKKALRRLRTACERAKIILSSITQTTIEIDSLYEGIDYQTSIARAKFEELNTELFQSTVKHIRKCLHDVKMDKSEVDEVVIVGGSTRIPKIQRILRNFFDDKNLNKSINADEAVAYGAAVQAAILAGDDSVKIILRDLFKHCFEVSIKTDIIKGRIKKCNTPTHSKNTIEEYTILDNQIVIRVVVGKSKKKDFFQLSYITNLHPELKRNTQMPAEKTGYPTKSDTKTTISVVVYERKPDQKKDFHQLSYFTKLPLREVEISVMIKIDFNGILKIDSANFQQKKESPGKFIALKERFKEAISREKKVAVGSNETQQLTIRNGRCRLSEDKIKTMICRAEKHRREDEISRIAINAKNKLQDFCYEMKGILIDNELGLLESDHAMILDKCNETIDWVDSDQMFKKEEYERKYENLGAEYKTIANNSDVKFRDAFYRDQYGVPETEATE